jgi:hypothetical protein
MPELVAIAKRAKFIQWAIVWTHVKKTIDQAVSLWRVMFLSKSMMLFSGVWRRREIRPRQTGKRINATSTCRVKAAALAMGYVIPKTALAFVRLS